MAVSYWPSSKQLSTRPRCREVSSHGYRPLLLAIVSRRNMQVRHVVTNARCHHFVTPKYLLPGWPWGYDQLRMARQHLAKPWDTQSLNTLFLSALIHEDNFLRFRKYISQSRHSPMKLLFRVAKPWGSNNGRYQVTGYNEGIMYSDLLVTCLRTRRQRGVKWVNH